jgi:hypothetical protein
MHRPLLGHGRAAVLRPLSDALLMLRAGHSGHPMPMAATVWLHGESMAAAAVAAAPRLHHESVAAATAVTVAATASGRLHDKRVSAAVAAAASSTSVAAATGSLHRRSVAAAAVASATAVRSCTCRGCDR